MPSPAARTSNAFVWSKGPHSHGPRTHILSSKFWKAFTVAVVVADVSATGSRYERQEDFPHDRHPLMDAPALLSLKRGVSSSTSLPFDLASTGDWINEAYQSVQEQDSEDLYLCAI